jgi:hypothetical protein|tara:strand:- start:699 stop:1637 length:939 start_codon:yes stop_codon:yes gene_type:complete
MSILATKPDLDKIITKAVKRIGENHALARDNNGVEMKAQEVEEDRKNFRKGRTEEVGNETMNSVIEESLKAVADEMAEKMVLENTIDSMIKDVIKPSKEVKDSKVEVNETTTETIKKLVTKKLKDKLSEAKHPGYDAYEKAVKKSKTENTKAMKDTKKKFKEYENFEGNENPQFPHQEMSQTNADGQFQYYRNDEKSQEFVDDFAHPGLIDFDINNVNMDRLTKYLEGSQETGNAQKDAEGEALGNVVPSDLGEKMLKSMKRRKEKVADQQASMTNLRGITPDVQKVKQVKEDVNIDVESMKKLWNYNKKTQ